MIRMGIYCAIEFGQELIGTGYRVAADDFFAGYRVAAAAAAAAAAGRARARAASAS